MFGGRTNAGTSHEEGPEDPPEGVGRRARAQPAVRHSLPEADWLQSRRAREPLGATGRAVRGAGGELASVGGPERRRRPALRRPRGIRGPALLEQRAPGRVESRGRTRRVRRSPARDRRTRRSARARRHVHRSADGARDADPSQCDQRERAPRVRVNYVD